MLYTKKNATEWSKVLEELQNKYRLKFQIHYHGCDSTEQNLSERLGTKIESDRRDVL